MENSEALIQYVNFDKEKFPDSVMGDMALGNVDSEIAEEFATEIIDIIMNANSNVPKYRKTNPPQSELSAVFQYSEDMRRWARGVLAFVNKYDNPTRRIQDAIDVSFFASVGMMFGGYTRTEDSLRAADPRIVSTYIVKNPKSGLIKIGKSLDIDKRLRTISTGAGCELEILAIIGEDVELVLHKKFASLRGVGEWFDDDGSIAEFAKAQNKVSL